MADSITPAYLTPAQTADYLSVSLRTVTNMRKSGHLRPFKAGRVVRYRRADLDALAA